MPFRDSGNIAVCEINYSFTSHGSMIPNEPGKNSPDERSCRARLS